MNIAMSRYVRVLATTSGDAMLHNSQMDEIKAVLCQVTAEAEAAGLARDAAELKLASLEESVPELELQNEGIKALVDSTTAEAADYQAKFEALQERVLELELLYKVTITLLHIRLLMNVLGYYLCLTLTLHLLMHAPGYYL